MAALTTFIHDRDSAGMTYVYPVVSRRASGVSVGVNLNTNHACNWRCVYCQVPELKRGGPPPVELDRLEDELRRMLSSIVHGDFLATQVPEGMRRLNDVALSGNGEPTTAREFPQAVALIGRVLADMGLAGGVKLVLITNGSQLDKADVRDGIRAMAGLNGEVWFKLDRATREGMLRVNGTRSDPGRHYQRLKACAGLCPTWVQTCLFTWRGEAPAPSEVEAYLGLLTRAVAEGVPLAGVLLYGLARPSRQPEAPFLGQVRAEWRDRLQAAISALGLEVRAVD